MKTVAIAPILEEFAERVRKLPEVKKIILYGSRARGDFEDISDYDVLVLVSVKNKNIEGKIDKIAWDINYRKLVSIVPILCTESRFIEEEYEPLFMNIKKEGVVL